MYTHTNTHPPPPFQPEMLIRNGFSADPYPAFYFKAGPDLGSQINAVPCGSRSWSDFAVKKSWILTGKKYLLKVICHKTYHIYVLRWYNSPFERLEIRLLNVNFDQFPCSRIRIRICIPNRDPDPGEPNQPGSGSETLHPVLNALY